MNSNTITSLLVNTLMSYTLPLLKVTIVWRVTF